jgi:hypothetical protein
MAQSSGVALGFTAPRPVHHVGWVAYRGTVDSKKKAVAMDSASLGEIAPPEERPLFALGEGSIELAL